MAPRKSKQASIQQIAEACNTSVMTVSRALRGGSGVAPETHQKILHAAETLGYRPRTKVGRPRRRESVVEQQVTAVICQHIAPSSLFTMELLVPLERELRRCGYGLEIRTVSEDYADYLQLVSDLQTSPSLSTLVIGYLPEDWLVAILETSPRPILIDHTGDPMQSGPCDSIAFDYVEAARMCVGHLLDTGRKRIVLLKGSQEHYFSRDIEIGYRDALRRAGLDGDECLIHQADFTAAGAAKAIGHLLDEDVPFDAVFTNDEMALGVIRMLHDRGVDCPEAVSVAGCDGLMFGQYLMPSLTTARVDVADLGRVVAERVAMADRTPDLSPCRLRLFPELVLRESTGKANHA